MTKCLMTVCVALLSGCVSPGAAKCSALRAELRASASACDACLADLSTHREPSVCEAHCAQPGTVGPLALGACSAAVPKPRAAAQAAAPQE